MPIVAASVMNDARGSAQLLVETAAECFTKPSTAPLFEVPLNNVYRLLEAFRSNLFFGVERSPGIVLDYVDPLERTVPSDTHLGDVRSALEEGLQVAFHNIKKEEAISQLENALRGLVYPNDFEKPSEQSLQSAKAFFDEVAKRLSAS